MAIREFFFGILDYHKKTLYNKIVMTGMYSFCHLCGRHKTENHSLSFVSLLCDRCKAHINEHFCIGGSE